MKWIVVLLIAILIASCFFPWITIEEKNIVVNGFDATGTNFGKPGLMNVILSAIVGVFILINKVWSNRAAFFISAFNIAWAIRNFIVISSCSGGTCPQKHTALYILLISSILIIVCSLLVPVKEKMNDVQNLQVSDTTKA